MAFVEYRGGVSVVDSEHVSDELQRFLQTDSDFLRLRREMVRLQGIDPNVAAYALLKTKMKGVAQATNFIFDQTEKRQM